MSEHHGSIRDEILGMVKEMGEDAHFDYCEDLDEYEDYLHELSTGELYDTYSIVSRGHERWLKQKRDLKNANAT